MSASKLVRTSVTLDGTKAQINALLDGLPLPWHALAFHPYEGGGFVVSHLDALAFLAEPDWIDGDLLPYDWYVAIIAGGARIQGLPAAYQARLRTVQTMVDRDRQRAASQFEIARGSPKIRSFFPVRRHGVGHGGSLSENDQGTGRVAKAVSECNGHFPDDSRSHRSGSPGLRQRAESHRTTGTVVGLRLG